MCIFPLQNAVERLCGLTQNGNVAAREGLGNEKLSQCVAL